MQCPWVQEELIPLQSGIIDRHVEVRPELRQLGGEKTAVSVECLRELRRVGRQFAAVGRGGNIS